MLGIDVPKFETCISRGFSCDGVVLKLIGSTSVQNIKFVRSTYVSQNFLECSHVLL